MLKKNQKKRLFIEKEISKDELIIDEGEFEEDWWVITERKCYINLTDSMWEFELAELKVRGITINYKLDLEYKGQHLELRTSAIYRRLQVAIPEAQKILQEREDRNAELEKLYPFIQELLTELRVTDEITLEEAVSVTLEEAQYRFLDKEIVAKIIRDIVQKMPQFEYIRLKKSIRIKENNFEVELDKLIQEMIRDQKEKN